MAIKVIARTMIKPISPPGTRKVRKNATQNQLASRPRRRSRDCFRFSPDLFDSGTVTSDSPLLRCLRTTNTWIQKTIRDINEQIH